MITLTRKEHFNAAHRLFREDFSAEKNLEIFGKCSNPNWHGHNYDLYVTVSGEINDETGFVINLKQLSDIINQYVIDKIDHKNINLEVDFMKGKMASTENLAIAIWHEIYAPLKALNARLHSVRLHETDNNYVEYFGN